MLNMLETEQRYKFITGDCLTEMKKMDDKSVNCIITSPPYWAMRKYDNAENEKEVGNELDFRITSRCLPVFSPKRNVSYLTKAHYGLTLATNTTTKP